MFFLPNQTKENNRCKSCYKDKFAVWRTCIWKFFLAVLAWWSFWFRIFRWLVTVGKAIFSSFIRNCWKKIAILIRYSNRYFNFTVVISNALCITLYFANCIRVCSSFSKGKSLEIYTSICLIFNCFNYLTFSIS